MPARPGAARERIRSTAAPAVGEKVLNALRDLPAGMIYTLGAKPTVLRGLALAIEKRVKGIDWSPDGATLFAEVMDGSRHHEVRLEANGGFLTPSCDCPLWRPTGHCPHVIAALAVLKKGLVHQAITSLRLDSDYLAEVSGWLSGVEAAQPTAPAVPRLVVERGADGIQARIWLGEHPVSIHDQALPRTVRDFLWTLLNPRESGFIIERYLEAFGDDAPMALRQDDNEIPLRFDRGRVHGTLTLLEQVRGMVIARKGLEDGHPIPDTCFAAYRYYFDIPAGAVRVIDSFEGWDLWNTINYEAAEWSLDTGVSVERNSRTISLPADAFNAIGLTVTEKGLPTILERIRFYGAGGPGEPARITHNYRLRVADMNDTTALLLAEGVYGDAAIPLSAGAFSFFTSRGRSTASVPLRTKKRSSAVIAGCFAALDCVTRAELERTIRHALAGDDFLKRTVKSEAKRIITAFAAACETRETTLLAADGAWLISVAEPKVEAQLLEIPYRLFGAEIFGSSDLAGAMTVNRDALFRQFPALHNRLAEAGFDLVLQDRPVEAVTLDVTLDATRSTLDWFELRPEIRCGTGELTEQEIAEAMASGGVFRRGDSFLLINEESSRILAMLYPEAGVKKRRKAEVVRIPRLQILDWLVLRHHGVSVRLSPEDERIFASLATFEEIPSSPLPERLQATLRHYQVDAFHWLAFLYTHRFGACLADDMGLGKTIQAISLLAALHEGTLPSRVPEPRPHLIVVPPSLLFNWENELARFYPAFTVLTYRGTGRSADFTGVDIVLTSYGIIPRDIGILAEIPFHCIVFDEAQAVKNIQADTTGACRRLRGAFTLCLTGTPVENHLGEYFSVMDLAVPGLLGSYEEFRRQAGNAAAPFLETLVRRTRPFVLRRSKQMIAAELPPKIETDIYLELTPRQKALYTRTVEEVRETVLEAWRGKSPGQARIIALTAILRLRQLCLSPRLLIADSREPSPKVEFLVEQLEELFTEGHSVLVFSQFTSFLDIVEGELSRRGVHYYRLDGSTPVPERKRLVTAFQKGDEPSVFLLSLKAGGKGLNLTRATYVFHLDPWWNPAVENQASDRAHRIGQTRQVTITRLVMRHTIEEKMMELKKRKLKLYHALLEENSAGDGGGISREDFEFLLG
ncbi:helicase, putative [Geobacter metallireducens GS-15]|uniref:Helicase, putative n=1 Tax=Geobacter metallireducens (strain ATCC 53774 / DSM 7210 / GS-15) TaxID=269799 RepID=Q39WY8_GEOMG|nr:DEAD/DEAH box helicase [Geobacter metallireducens]ABB31236.1 helicase, putative [Geobacter metallireducens GS-15]